MRKEKMEEFLGLLNQSKESVSDKLKRVQSDIVSTSDLVALKEEELRFIEEYQVNIELTLSKLKADLVHLRSLEEVLGGSNEALQELVGGLGKELDTNKETEGSSETSFEETRGAKVETSFEETRGANLGTGLGLTTSFEAPKMTVKLQTLEDVRKMSATLLSESAETVMEPLVGKEVHTPVFKGKERLSEVESDYIHKGYVLSHYLHPVETDEGYEVWLRRAMITHYLSSGIVVTKSLVDRYNTFSRFANLKETTASAVSKDIYKIFNKEFSMVSMEGQEGKEEFTPSMILSAVEKSRLDSLLVEQMGKNPNYESFIKTFVMREFTDMTRTKVRAVDCYIKERL